MRGLWTLGGPILIGLVLGNCFSSPARAQSAALAVIETSGCAPTTPQACRASLVNRNTGGRVVVNLQRRDITNFPLTMYDQRLRRISQGDTQFEVLLGAGDRAPLIVSLGLYQPLDANPSHYGRYEYSILGAHAPGPDDIPDAAPPNVADYFRLVVVRTPAFDNSDACRTPAGPQPAAGLVPVNFHPTRTIVITHRNVAPRYGSNPQSRVDYIPPGGGPITAVGCETDIALGYVEIQDVRFM